MDKLTAMNMFIQTAKLGNFTAAADMLNTTQSTVSKKVAALEKEIGIELFHRSSRVVQLTQHGEQYYEVCCNVLEQLGEVESQLSDQKSLPSGPLSVTAPYGFGEQLLVPIIDNYLSLNPNVEIKLILDDEPIDLYKQNIDVAIRAQHLQDSSMRSRFLFNNKVSYCASPAYFEKYGVPNSPTELTHHQCLTYSLSKSSRSVWKIIINDEVFKIPVSGRFVSNNAQSLLNMARLGKGIVAMPNWMVNDAILKGELLELFAHQQAHVLPMYALYKNSQHTPLSIRTFIDFLVEEIEDL